MTPPARHKCSHNMTHLQRQAYKQDLMVYLNYKIVNFLLEQSILSSVTLSKTYCINVEKTTNSIWKIVQLFITEKINTFLNIWIYMVYIYKTVTDFHWPDLSNKKLHTLKVQLPDSVNIIDLIKSYCTLFWHKHLLVPKEKICIQARSVQVSRIPDSLSVQTFHQIQPSSK